MLIKHQNFQAGSYLDGDDDGKFAVGMPMEVC
jgi:hypothetical protein